ncbi:MAG: ABC transporter ATP-binding protein [Fimbriimonadaceae bacterium]|nr:ABC transporter ATP-binding protein [Fimbriimonadaceae bacterium]
MSAAAITISGLCKAFTLTHGGAASLKTALLWWKRRSRERLVILENFNLELKRGECVAIVGRNGAGKSTLLSLIARVYKPDSGTIEINGRIAPLLELGAGFHPDLTGQENVLFNAMILGLTRKQATERMDAIIEFAELQKHRDAPVRTYSSGMLARLGFATAIHVDAEILIVDEVLAVGDFAFERKCYDTIADFVSKGGSVLFVSHDRDAVERAASRAIWLRGGEIVLEGNPGEILDAYEASAT